MVMTNLKSCRNSVLFQNEPKQVFTPIRTVNYNVPSYHTNQVMIFICHINQFTYIDRILFILLVRIYDKGMTSAMEDPQNLTYP